MKKYVIAVLTLLAINVSCYADGPFGEFSKQRLKIKLEAIEENIAPNLKENALPGYASAILPAYLILSDGHVSFDMNGNEYHDDNNRVEFYCFGGFTVPDPGDFTEDHFKAKYKELEKYNKVRFEIIGGVFKANDTLYVITIPYIFDDKKKLKFSEEGTIEMFSRLTMGPVATCYTNPNAMPTFVKDRIKCTVLESTFGESNAGEDSATKSEKEELSDSKAISSLREISTVCESYRAQQSPVRYPPNLKALFEANPPYVDQETGNGKKNGYIFTYTFIDANKYTCVASPEKPSVSGNKTYFVDETGVIRLNNSIGAPTE